MTRSAAWLSCSAMTAMGFASAAYALAGPSTEQIAEIVVTSERAGPGLWHVQQGGAQLWIFGIMSPLPKDMTWRSKQLESVLDSTNQLLVAKPLEVGVARAVWLMVTQRQLFLLGHGKKLKDVLPPDLYSRFAAQRAKYSGDDAKWEKYRPIIAAAFLEEDALHKAGLSTHLDLAEEVRKLAHKHHVRIEEFKVTGLHDVLDALKTLPPQTEQKCVAASLSTIESGLPRLTDRALAWATGDIDRILASPESSEVAACREAVTVDPGAGDLLALLRKTWLANMEEHLKHGGVTLAVVNIDMLIEPGGFLDELRARGYRVDAP
jgi:uncharacterized protein YbaP (TraB family)